MTEEEIKEQLSRNLVRLLAARRGFKCTSDHPDHGTDLLVSRALPLERFGKTRMLSDGRFVELQLKCFCENRFHVYPSELAYDLEAKTFNDLVDRRNSTSPTPFYLVVVRLPDAPSEWVTVTADSLVLKRAAYWYRPAVGAARSPNEQSVRIRIPLTNMVDTEFLPGVFASEYP